MLYNYDPNLTIANLTNPQNRDTIGMGGILAAMLDSNIRNAGRLVDIMDNNGAVGAWDISTEYGIGDKVTDKMFSSVVYVSLVNHNIGNPLNDKNYWEIWRYDVIPINIRKWIDGSKTRLEYALNYQFWTTFQQPGSLVPSEINLEQLTPTAPSYLVGATVGDYVGASGSTAWVGETEVFEIVIGFKINFPLILFNMLGDTDPQREATVRKFVDKYVTAGLTYTIYLY